MTVLETPNGIRYATDDEAEIRNLTVGHGYRIVASASEPEPPQRPSVVDWREWPRDDDNDEDPEEGEEGHPIGEDVQV